MKTAPLSSALLVLHALALAHQVSALHVGDAHQAYDRGALLEERHHERRHVCADAPRAETPEACPAFTASRTPCISASGLAVYVPPRPCTRPGAAGPAAARVLPALRVAPKTSPPA